MLNPRCVALLEKLTKEMDSDGTFFAMVIVEGDGDISYAGNVPSNDGARLMREWLDSAKDGSIGATGEAN